MCSSDLAEHRLRACALVTLAALVGLLAAGLTESDLLGSGLWLLPIMFSPLCLAAALGRAAVLPYATEPRHSATASPAIRLAAWGGALATAAIVAAAAPGIRAQWFANRGALLQTRTELAVYAWPAWPSQDSLRRSDAVQLGPAIEQYERALRLAPANATAHRRLGQITLSRGDISTARGHLEATLRAAPHDQIGRAHV